MPSWYERGKKSQGFLDSPLHGLMQADAAEDVGIRAHLRVTHAFEQRREILDGDETSNRMRNVGVDASTPVQQQPPEAALDVQIGQINLAQDRVRGKKEIQAHHQPARPRDALNYPQRHAQIRKIPQPIADEYAIERAIGKWQGRRVPADRIRESTARRA